MAVGRTRTQRSTGDAWPGFVDVLSTLLLVIVFLLVVFVLAQFFLSQALSGRDEALQRLSRQVNELADLLSLERQANAELRLNVAQLSASLQDSSAARDALVLRLDTLTRRLETAEASAAQADEALRVQLAEAESLKRDIAALRQLRAELEAQVAAATGEVGQLRDRAKELEARLASEQERTALAQKEVAERDVRLSELQALYLKSDEQLKGERQLSAEAQAQVQALNQQLLALRQQLARLEAALEVAESKDKEQEATIADLGKRLNLALAQKVEELARYRSEFFGRLRELLGARRDITIVGDRFVFQSEVLFEPGSADLGEGARQQLATLARTLLEIAEKIPPEINWVLRVDGHTDVVPIRTPQFPSNWELSAARAIAVAKFLTSQGVPPNRLAATGFGEFHPLDSRHDEIGFRRNRRIELKLTER